MGKYGSTWAELRLKIMTPEERAESERRVKVLGGLLDALEAGTITQAEFDAAFDKLEPPIEAETRLPVVRPRSTAKARTPKVAF